MPKRCALTASPAVTVIHRLQPEPIRGMANRSVALVRIGGQENIAFFDCSFIRVQKAVDKRPELSDNHAALAVRDQRKLTHLLPANRRKPGTGHPGVPL